LGFNRVSGGCAFARFDARLVPLAAVSEAGTARREKPNLTSTGHLLAAVAAVEQLCTDQ
jgi:hypothetical protein